MEERLVSDGSDNNYRYNNETNKHKEKGGRVGVFAWRELSRVKLLGPKARENRDRMVKKWAMKLR